MPKYKRKKGEDFLDQDYYENTTVGGKASLFELFSVGGYLRAKIKKDATDPLWWLMVIGVLLFALSAIGFGLYYNWNKPVMVTHIISKRDEHNAACNALLTANGNLLDDDDSDDFCLWREHEYNITWTLLVTVALCINTVILCAGYLNWGRFLSEHGMHNDHLMKLDNVNGESIFYFKASYQWWWWLTVSAMLGQFSAYMLAVASLLGLLYSLALALTQQSSQGFEKKGNTESTASDFLMFFTPYRNVLSGPIIFFFIFVYWITFLNVQYFHVFTSHIHHIDHYITFVFIWDLVFVSTEFFFLHVVQIWIQRRLNFSKKELKQMGITKEERNISVQKVKYNTQCIYIFHQILYIIGGIWILAGFLYNTKFII